MKTTYLNYNYNTSLVFVENEQDKSLFSNPCFWVDIALTVVYQIILLFISKKKMAWIWEVDLC